MIKTEFFDFIATWLTVKRYRLCTGAYCLHLESEAVQDDDRPLLVNCLTLNMETLRFFETSVNFYKSTHHNIPQDLTIQQHSNYTILFNIIILNIYTKFNNIIIMLNNTICFVSDWVTFSLHCCCVFMVTMEVSLWVTPQLRLPLCMKNDLEHRMNIVSPSDEGYVCTNLICSHPSVAGSCECVDEPLGCTKCGEFLE
jgi:hypothetical protein